MGNRNTGASSSSAFPRPRSCMRSVLILRERSRFWSRQKIIFAGLRRRWSRSTHSSGELWTTRMTMITGAATSSPAGISGGSSAFRPTIIFIFYWGELSQSKGALTSAQQLVKNSILITDNSGGATSGDGSFLHDFDGESDIARIRFRMLLLSE